MLWWNQVKSALALSVCDGNGAVSSLASQAISWVGRDWRGYCAACASGAEKSRHFKQATLGVVAGKPLPCIRGLVAMILERSGRDAKGTGGGTPFEGCS